MAGAAAGVSATSPAGTGTPNSRKIAFAWYSWIFMWGASAQIRKRTHRVAAVPTRAAP